jgi:hypothetical protein
MKKFLMILTVVSIACAGADSAAEKTEDGWVTLFDGKSLDGWKANENLGSWEIAVGAIVCQGQRSHLFYMGDQTPLKNFHLKVDVLTKPGSNAGIYFHTRFQESGWPKHGYEAQVNNTGGDPQKTGSLYSVKSVTEAPAKDDTWFTQEIIVEGTRIQIKVDGKTLVDFTEEPDRKAGADFTRILSEGTIAFQAHDPNSRVYFKNIRLKKLP